MPQLFAPLADSLMIFFCTFAAAVSGMVLRRKLPDGHLSEDSKDVIKLVMGLIATMAALVLGLLIASANSSYETQNGELQQVSASTAFWRNMGRRQTNRAKSFGSPFQRRLTKSGRRTVSGWD
jgi:amino acid transporter